MRHKANAFTLVELLVVVTIIGILMALLIPAVQASREAARQTVTKNNLKQIGLALHNHHSALSTLPAGWIATDPAIDNRPGWGWATMILPYMEQGDLFRAYVDADGVSHAARIDRDAAIDHANNVVGRTTVLSTFLCPSDPTTETFTVFDESSSLPMFKVARSNFVGVFGTLEIEDVPDNGDGVFFRNSRVHFDNIADGLSNTILVGQRSSRLGGSTWLGAIEGATHGLALCVGTTDHVPNSEAGHFDDFSSDHATGAYFLLGDGSVRLISNSIDFLLYRHLATRAGHEPIDMQQVR